MKGIEIFDHEAEGYAPLVISQDWMVALLNYEEGMSPQKATLIERHVLSDEVFILLTGKAVMYYIAEDQPLQVIELLPGKVLNVKAGTWHNLIATQNVSLAIVENKGTDQFDSEIRSLQTEEIGAIFQQIPDWVKNLQGDNYEEDLEST